MLAGRLGVDAIALVSMTAALALGQRLAGAVVALMYSGGNVLEEIAVSRAEHNLRSLVDRAGRNDYQPGERQYGCFRQLRTFCGERRRSSLDRAANEIGGRNC